MSALEADELLRLAIGVIVGWVLGMATMWWEHRAWRRMYDRGEAECWRCHGSGKERNQ